MHEERQAAPLPAGSAQQGDDRADTNGAAGGGKFAVVANEVQVAATAAAASAAAEADVQEFEENIADLLTLQFHKFKGALSILRQKDQKYVTDPLKLMADVIMETGGLGIELYDLPDKLYAAGFKARRTIKTPNLRDYLRLFHDHFIVDEPRGNGNGFYSTSGCRVRSRHQVALADLISSRKGAKKKTESDEEKKHVSGRTQTQVTAVTWWETDKLGGKLTTKPPSPSSTKSAPAGPTTERSKTPTGLQTTGMLRQKSPKEPGGDGGGQGRKLREGSRGDIESESENPNMNTWPGKQDFNQDGI
jgi:hypothetical protein